MSSPILEPGQTLDGKYRIESFLGQGGMGFVYRATHLRLAAPRAIKVMHGGIAEDEDLLRRFENEARLVAELRHPNIVTVFDFSPLPGGAWYMVMELVEGRSLRELLNRRARFSPAEVQCIVNQVADALAVAHARGILHRDVSPDNIMVVPDADSRHHAKLLDFGLAKSLINRSTVQTAAGAMFGKLGYAAPEQFGVLPPTERLDARVDVFSLAVVTYEMLTGVTPFARSDPHAYLHELTVASEARIQARFTQQLPVPFRTALCPALSRDRNARTPTILAFRHAVDRAARITEKQTARPTRGEPRPAPRERLRTVTRISDPDWLLYNGTSGSDGDEVSARSTKKPHVARARKRFPIEPGRPLRWGLATLGVLVLAATALTSWLVVEQARQSMFQAPAVPSLPDGSEAAPRQTPSPGLGSAEIDRLLSQPQTPRGVAPSGPDTVPAPGETGPGTETPQPKAHRDRGLLPEAPVNKSRLSVTARPSTQVSIDGIPIGRTPLDVDLDPGSYFITFGSPESPLWTERLVVRDDTQHRLSRDFQNRGRVSVASDTGTMVSLGGNRWEPSPVMFQSVPAGTHSLTANRQGTTVYETWIEVIPGNTTAVAVPEVRPR